MFPNASCLKKSSENQSHDTSFSQSNLHSNIGLALQICFVLYDTLPHGEHPSCAVRTSSHMEKPNANHTVDLRRVGSLTHADNNIAFVLKSSTRTVNRIPMLIIRRFRGQPAITILAQRALHHLNEIMAQRRLLIASAPICHHPPFGRNLNIR